MIENEFAPLFEEIVQQDCYRLRSLPFTPDVVFDIGANVGVFASYARFLFPKATVICLEPDNRNYGLLFRHCGHLPRMKLLNVALGTGPIWTKPVASICSPYFNGGAQYVSEGQLGFTPQTFADSYEPSQVDRVSLNEIMASVWPTEEMILLCKIDIEGAENCIFNHGPSMDALRRMDYVAMEVHFPLDTHGPVWQDGSPTIRQSLLRLRKTHDVVFDEPKNLFYATRKEFK